MRHANRKFRRPDKDDILLWIGEAIVIGSVIFSGLAVAWLAMVLGGAR